MSSRSEFSRHNQARPTNRLTRRRLLAIGVPTAAAAAFGAVCNHGFRETRELSLKEVLIPVHQLPPAFDGFTIAQLSDFHYHPLFTAKAIGDAVHLVNQLHPDIVVLTGTSLPFPTSAQAAELNLLSRPQAEPCAELLSQLRAKHGKFAVLGNHDQASEPGIVAQSL